MTIKWSALTVKDAQDVFPKQGQMDLSEYEDMVVALIGSDSQVAKIELGGLSQRALKRRVGQAAKRHGRSVKWKKWDGDQSMIFKLSIPTPRKDLKETDGRHRKRS